MHKADFHIHSIYSKDSLLRIRFILKKMKSLGFDTVAISDHNSIKGGIIGKKLGKKFDVKVLVGQEIKTPEGEIIVLNVERDLRGGIFEIIEKAKEEGGITILPHPFDPIRRNSVLSKSGLKKTLKIVKRVDAIECLNSRCMLNIFNKKAKYYAHLFKKACVGGSDSHTPGELGSVQTLFEGDLYDAIKKQKTAVFGKTNCPCFHFQSLFFKYSKKLFSGYNSRE